MTILCLAQTALLCLILWRLGRLEGQTAAPSQPQEPPNPQAAQAMERFNAGVANILAYDPFEKGGGAV